MQLRVLWVLVIVLLVVEAVRGVGTTVDDASAFEPPAEAVVRDFDARLSRLERLLQADPPRDSGIDPAEVAVRTPTDLLRRVAALEQRVAQLKSADAAASEPDPRIVRRLNAAIARGDAAEVLRMLDGGLDVDARDDDRQTPLISAAIAGQNELIDALIERGADLERRGARGMTALLAALDADQDGVAYDLLTRGADMRVVDKNGEGALFWAASNNCKQVVDHLLASGYPVNFVNHVGTTALMEAAENGRFEIVLKLLDAGADVNLRSRSEGGATALDRALAEGHDKIADLLRQRGATRSGHPK